MMKMVMGVVVVDAVLGVWGVGFAAGVLGCE